MPLYLFRPGTYVSYVPMSDVDPAAIPCALDMGCGAVVTPVPLLVTPATDPPCGASFIVMVSADLTALTAVMPGQLHRLLLLLSPDLHCSMLLLCVARRY